MWKTRFNVIGKLYGISKQPRENIPGTEWRAIIKRVGRSSFGELNGSFESIDLPPEFEDSLLFLRKIHRGQLLTIKGRRKLGCSRSRLAMSLGGWRGKYL